VEVVTVLLAAGANIEAQDVVSPNDRWDLVRIVPDFLPSFPLLMRVSNLSLGSKDPPHVGSSERRGCVDERWCLF
jgi:hypothetical protein